MEEIRIYLENVKIAKKQSCRNLSLFPLIASGNGGPDYLTLDQAMEKDLVDVREVSESGSVPDLLLLNRGSEHILIVEGEELVGAKQNRIVNATFLIMGNTKIELPVSCVEQGRWRYSSPEFAGSGRMMHASLRRQSQHFVGDNLAAGLGFRSDQGEIWSDISGKAQRLKAHAPTVAMSDVYESTTVQVDEYLGAFNRVESQVGAIFTINGEIAGMDCFGYADTFARFFEKLVKSYALDAIDWAAEHKGKKTVSQQQARKFMSAVAECPSESRASLGLGENVRLNSISVSGAALVKEKKVLHLAAFKAPAKKSEQTGYQRFSGRRAFRNRY